MPRAIESASKRCAAVPGGLKYVGSKCVSLRAGEAGERGDCGETAVAVLCLRLARLAAVSSER